MRLKTQRRVVYAVMGLAVLALTSGYALASLSLGTQTTPSQQGSATTTVDQVQGLTYLETSLTTVPSGFSNTSGCATPTGCSVTSTSATNCVGSLEGTGHWCVLANFVEEIVLETVFHTPFSGPVQITMYIVCNGTTYAGTPLNYTDGSGNMAVTITQYFDIGTPSAGLATVSAVTVVATATG